MGYVGKGEVCGVVWIWCVWASVCVGYVYVVWGVCLRMGVCGDSGEYVCGYGSDGHGWCSVCVM